MKATLKKWQNAQKAEIKIRGKREKQDIKLYNDLKHRSKLSYERYFQYLNIEKELKGKFIIEIGSGDFPALIFCSNYAKSYIIEPIGSVFLHMSRQNQNIIHINNKAEIVLLKKNLLDFKKENSEVWLLNVLQHVQEPDKIIELSKEVASIIRFFEPINYPVDKMHIHEFTLAYFKKHFGDCVKHYKTNPKAKFFHTHECAYGVYNSNN